VRTEFGAQRTECACKLCVLNCKVRPGALIPADLDRMIPKWADDNPDEKHDLLTWAESNLLASPGAIVSKDGELFRISSLVPATREDGSCINLTADGRCSIHETAPFGCAFFDCKSDPRDQTLMRATLNATWEALADSSTLYAVIWEHLWKMGRRQDGPEILSGVYQVRMSNRRW